MMKSNTTFAKLVHSLSRQVHYLVAIFATLAGNVG